METFFSNFSVMERNGIILLAVSTPLMIWTLWNWHLSVRSKTWPKVKGEILDVAITRRPYLIKYQYRIAGKLYENDRIFFTNSREWERRAKTFRNMYQKEQIVDIFYNPNNVKMAVLQPGRRDGLLTSILFLTAFITVGGMALYDPYSTQEYISKILQLFK